MKKNYFFLILLLFSSLSYITNNITSISDKIKVFEEKRVTKERRIMMLKSVVEISHFASVKSNEGYLYAAKGSAKATGFSIEYKLAGHKSRILTNEHFCDSLDNSGVLIFQNYLGEIIFYKSSNLADIIIKKDNYLDLCLIQIDGLVNPVKLTQEAGDFIGEEVWIIGAPKGIFPIIIKTYISGIIPRSNVEKNPLDYGDDLILVSSIIYPGHSGSPVFLPNGEVAGIIFAAVDGYGGLAISNKDISYFLNGL